MSVDCDRCGAAITRPDQVVTVNGRNVHPLTCFDAELRSLKSAVTDIAVGLPPSMRPEDAYRLGKVHVAVIVAERRKAKKKK